MKEGNAKMKSNRKYPPQQTGWVTAEAIIIIIIKSVLTHSDNTGNGNYAQKIQENCSHRETGKSFKNHTKKTKQKRDGTTEGREVKLAAKSRKTSGFAKIFGIRNMRQNDNKCGEEKKGGNE